MKPHRIRRGFSPFDPISRNERARTARLTLGLLFGVLVIAFFRLQVIQHEIHTEHSTDNQVRTIPLSAPRGFIYDRDGEVIAENLPAYAVSYLPESDEDLDTGLGRIAPILEIDPAEIDDLKAQYRLAPGRPILLDNDIDYRTLSLLEERRSEVPGLLLRPKPRRVYPQGRATAHLTGYVAQISSEELAERGSLEYSAGDVIGKTGLERMYESQLRGEKGAERFEVDALGRRVGPWRENPFDPPQRGEDMKLAVDLDLQRKAEQLFANGQRGAAVALDPRTGEVLLLYSSPTFDPNVFSGRLTQDAWGELLGDPGRPLLNRVIQARYAPGSVFKLATSAMAMLLGVSDPEGYEDVPCRGGYQFGTRWFGCHASHGWATLRDAIITSCDTYFYQVGLKLGLEELTRQGIGWGFEKKTGIDLPNEVEGIFPTSTAWYDERYGTGRWGSGVVLNLSIGQGEIAATPIKMAQFVAAVVNGGRMLKPRLLLNGGEAEVTARLPLSQDQFAILNASLSGVVNDWRGTAYLPTRDLEMRYTIGGKSGTAEQSGGEPNAWFVAVGPMEDPQIVVAVVVEEGGNGSDVSPLAIELVQTYLDLESGIVPSDPGPPPPIALSESVPD